MNISPRLLLPALALLTLGLPSHAAILSVGSDAGCSHGSVQSAIDALPSGGTHEIHIRTGSYSEQAITISARSVAIIGGYANCGDAAPSGLTTLSGQGGGPDSVITMGGANNAIVLQSLVLIRGDEVSDGHGGGIDFRGSGVLTLRNVGIAQNYAGYGGGISFVGSGGVAELHLEGDTVIQFNQAQYSGGGIRMEGDAHLYALHDRTMIANNEAIGINPATSQPQYGYGGGILLLAPASAHIGSPGYGNSGVINNNKARYGGGLAVYADGDTEYQNWAYLFTTDAARPIRIHDNAATQTGGGIYLFCDWEFFDGGSYASVFAWDLLLERNTAQNGSAVYMDMDGEDAGRLFMNVDIGEIVRPVEQGAVPCNLGAACSGVLDNVAENGNGQPTDGAAILMQDGGELRLDRVRVTGNMGTQALRSFGWSDLYNVEFSGNATTGPLLRQEERGRLLVENTTIAGNGIGAGHVISTAGDLRFRRSVLWQPGKTSLSRSGGDLDVGDLVVSERTSLDGGNTPYVLEADPRFVDPDHGNLHLQASSPAVDYASTGGGLDLDGNVRGVDLPITYNLFGAGDLGAYERPALLPLVRNGDLDADARLWTDLVPGGSSWTADQNGAGPAGSGSIRVDLSNIPQTRMTLRSQCIQLPGPGRYLLNGWGRAGAGPLVNRDYTLLHWELRHDGGGGCNGGPAVASGDHGLGSSSSWSRPGNPAVIDVSPSGWTWQSSINVMMVVIDNGITAPPRVTGWFDGITLDVEGSDAIFADDFEP